MNIKQTELNKAPRPSSHLTPTAYIAIFSYGIVRPSLMETFSGGFIPTLIILHVTLTPHYNTLFTDSTNN